MMHQYWKHVTVMLLVLLQYSPSPLLSQAKTPVASVDGRAVNLAVFVEGKLMSRGKGGSTTHLLYLAQIFNPVICCASTGLPVPRLFAPT